MTFWSSVLVSLKTLVNYWKNPTEPLISSTKLKKLFADGFNIFADNLTGLHTKRLQTCSKPRALTLPDSLILLSGNRMMRVMCYVWWAMIMMCDDSDVGCRGSLKIIRDPGVPCPAPAITAHNLHRSRIKTGTRAPDLINDPRWPGRGRRYGVCKYSIDNGYGGQEILRHQAEIHALHTRRCLINLALVISLAWLLSLIRKFVCWV